MSWTESPMSKLSPDFLLSESVYFQYVGREHSLKLKADMFVDRCHLLRSRFGILGRDRE